MFLDEARIASRLSHPNIIAIHGLGHDGKRHFLAMEVLRGRTLLELWEQAHSREAQASLRGRRVDRRSRRRRAAPRARAARRRGQGAPRHPPRRQPVEHLLDRRRRPQAHRLRARQGARPHRLDGDRRHQGQARVPRARAGARPLGRPARGHLRAGRDALGDLARPPPLPERQRRRDGAPGARRRRPGPDDASSPTTRRRSPRRSRSAPSRRIPAARFQTAAGLRDALDAFVAVVRRGRPTSSGCSALVAELFDGASRASWERLHRRGVRPPRAHPRLGRRRAEDDVDERRGRSGRRRLGRTAR